MKQKQSLIFGRVAIIVCFILLTVSCNLKKKSEIKKDNNTTGSLDTTAINKNISTYPADVTFMKY